MLAMENSPSHSTEADEGQGAVGAIAGAPLTLEAVRGALQELQAEGHPATHRNVRDRLGRGSMTTVNKLIRQIAAEQAPELPLLELTNTDQDLIARLATELLSVATSRVGQLMAERETMLKRRAEEAEARAATAISVADNEVTMALLAARRAREERDTAQSLAVAAQTVAEETVQRALRLDGQVAQLIADRDQAIGRVADLEADLAAATARAETEAKSRSRAEELGQRSIAEASTLRSQTAALQQQIADMTQRFTEALTAAEERLTSTTQDHDTAQIVVRQVEAQLAQRNAELSESQALLAASLAVNTHDRLEIDRLAAELAAGRMMLSELTTALTESGKRVQALASSLVDRAVEKRPSASSGKAVNDLKNEGEAG